MGNKVIIILLILFFLVSMSHADCVDLFDSLTYDPDGNGIDNVIDPGVGYAYRIVENTTLCSRTYLITAPIYESALIIENSNIVLDCNNSLITSGGVDTGYGISSISKSNLIIKNCQVEDYKYGIYIEDSFSSSLINNTLRLNEDAGIYLNSFFFGKLTNNILRLNEDIGISFFTCSNGIIENNIIADNTGVGFLLNLDSDHNTISNNRIELNNVGLRVYYADYNEIINNSIFSNDEYGIYSAYSSRNQLINNSIFSNGNIGFELYRGDHNHLEKNNFFDNINIGVNINSNSDYNTFINNKFNQPLTDLRINEPASQNNIFYQNYFYSSNIYVYNDGDSSNKFSNLVGGVEQGNYYSVVEDYSIFDTDGDGYGDFGIDIPYDQSKGRWVGLGEDWGPITNKTPCLDEDGDGYGVCPNCGIAYYCTYDGDDCNDFNSSINPGAVEICDDLDNNCNGMGDEPYITFYFDFDLDTFGNLTNTIQDCSAPTGYVPDNTDCNDNNADMFPGNPEICDGLDNDCNINIDDGLIPPPICLVEGICLGTTAVCEGVSGWQCNYPIGYELDEITCDYIDNDCDSFIDEGLLLTFYFDFDLDVFGNLTNTIQDCSVPTGYVSDNTDCNDHNSLINPLAVDIPDNGIDENCDGADAVGSCVDLDNPYSISAHPNIEGNLVDGFTIHGDVEICEETYVFTGFNQSLFTIDSDGIIINCTGAEFDGDAEADETGKIGVYALAKRNFEIKNCTFNNFYTGMKFDQTINAIVRNNQLNNSLYIGIYEKATEGTLIQENTISNAEAYGILLWGSENEELVDNTLENNGWGIYFRETENCDIYGNTITDSNIGVIMAYHSKYNNLYSNIINENEIGVEISSIGGESTYNIVSDNTIKYNTLYAINIPTYYYSLSAVDNTFSNNNMCSNFGEYDIYDLSYGYDDNTYSGNSCDADKKYVADTIGSCEHICGRLVYTEPVKPVIITPLIKKENPPTTKNKELNRNLIIKPTKPKIDEVEKVSEKIPKIKSIPLSVIIYPQNLVLLS